nr:MAG TPA: hypothetical protein [Caudoviricetes sp.]DAT07305.1 MAG TPA: hypothetical protein [Caudoviricetes sp.]
MCVSFLSDTVLSLKFFGLSFTFFKRNFKLGLMLASTPFTFK